MIHLFLAAIATAIVGEFHTQTTPEPGKWCSDYASARSYSEAHNMPMILVYGREGCGHCTKLKNAVMQEDFIAWQEEYPIVLCYSTYGDREAQEFADTPVRLSSLPLVAMYWPKGDGISEKINFTGADGKMPVTVGTLQQQLMRSAGKIFSGYWGYDPTLPKLAATYELNQYVSFALQDSELIGFTAKGLPAGLKYEKKSGDIFGVPKKSGEYKVVLTKKGWCTLSTQMIVTDFTRTLVGTFNGLVGDKGKRRGTLSMTVSNAGTITAKAVLPDGTKTYKSTGFDEMLEDGSYSVEMETKKGETLDVVFTPCEDWAALQLSGDYFDMDDEKHAVSAQRNVLSGRAANSEAKALMTEFADKYAFDTIEQADGSWEFAEAANPKKPGMTVQLQKNGQIKVNGTLGTIKVTATGMALPLRADLDAGQLTLEATKPLRVNGQRRAASIIMTISEDGSATGFARIVE